MYILTAKLDEKSQKLFNHLRKEYFPAHLNYVDAHLTLLSHLPENQLHLSSIQEGLPKSKIEVLFDEVYFTGNGFAVEALSPELSKISSQILQHPDERRLHVTLSSKSDPSKALEKFEAFSKRWSSFRGEVEGIEVWKSLNGPWALVKAIPFK